MSNKESAILIDEYAKRAYLEYAMTVVCERAIPFVHDGQKPVQRRVLYAMTKLHLDHNASPMKAARVVGDCFVKGSLIHTASGLKTIENVELGDFVRMPNGKNSKVVKLFHNPPSKLVRLNLSSGFSLEVTPDQLFKVLNDELDISWEKADTLNGKNILISNLNSFDFNKLNISDKNIDKAYSAGLLVAEGYLSDRGRSTRVGISMIEKEPLEVVERVCVENGVSASWSLRNPKQKHHNVLNTLRFSSFEDFYNICVNKCATKEVPEWILNDRSLYVPFIAGFIDGDGCVRNRKSSKEFVLTTTSYTLSKQLNAILLDMGIYSHLTKVERKNKNWLDCYQLIITGTFALKLADLIKFYLKVKDKKNRVEKLLKNNRVFNTQELTIPSKTIWSSLSESHLGGGWYINKEGNKFRSGIKYPNKSKIRYSKDLNQKTLSLLQLKDLGILNKLEAIESPLVEKINDYFANYAKVKVVSVEVIEPKETYDVQIDDESHALIIEGCIAHNCIGKYHPHGDTATYDAMVRMSQDFLLRYPLVHGEGNFGSRDGDKAAAYRYTEAKMSKITDSLIDELRWDTVDMRDNFDGKEKEPWVLPSRLPMLMLNGASGIAVGMATEFPPHNIKEVVEGAKLLLKKPKTTAEELFEVIPGPDYPTGGVVINSPKEILATYNEGRGAFRLRSRWKVEQEGKNWALVFYEIPYKFSAEKIMEEIADLMEPKPKESKGKESKGKKSSGKVLSQDQIRLKKLFNELIKSYDNGSDRNEPIRIVVRPVDKSMSPDDLALTLCAHTSLEINVPVNMVAVDLKGTPRSGSLHDWMSQWCDFRLETIRRRSVDQKQRVDKRLHILKGRLTILDKIHEVVKMLTTSENPKERLMEDYGLDEIQAEDILETKLRSLARLEKHKLQEEFDKLTVESGRLEILLSDEKNIRKLAVQELDSDLKIYSDERKTLLEEAKAIRVNDLAKSSVIAEKMAPEPVAVALTERGWIAWRPAKNLEEAMAMDFKIKAGDKIKRVYFGDRSEYLLILNNKGRAFGMSLTSLPSKADTAPLSTWFDSETGTKFLDCVIANDNRKLILIGEKGSGFVVKASDWMNRQKAGKSFMTLKEGENPLPPYLLPQDLDVDKTLLLALSTDGRAVSFNLKELPELPKGKGNAVMGLAPDCLISDFTIISESQDVEMIAGKKTYKIPYSEVQELIGARSSSKKGKALHKSSAKAIFARNGRETSNFTG